jgi:NADPH-dependent ferric siderophore reductase
MGNGEKEPHGADAAMRDAVTMDAPRDPGAIRLRREPPRFRRVTVAGVEPLSPRLVRVTFTGTELDGFTLDEPAASVRLLLPPRGATDLVMPEWNGNEFLLPDGRRAPIRTFTPRHFDASAATPSLALDMVRHDGGGVASDWAGTAGPGDAAAISGPGSGYTIAPDAPAFFLAGDDTAIPAISQLLEALPAGVPVRVAIEIAHPDARIDLPDHPNATVTWHHAADTAGDALVAAVEAATFVERERIWVAGEAAAVQRVRRHLFEARGIARRDTSVRGYWKRGRRGDDDAST